MNKVKAIAPGRVVAEAGVILAELDEQTRAAVGQELRLHPSTYRTASIGGFIAGGSGGVGSIRWGGLRDLGNVLRLRVVTMEAEPRVLDLDRRGPPEGRCTPTAPTASSPRSRCRSTPAYDWVDVDRRLRRLHGRGRASPTALGDAGRPPPQGDRRRSRRPIPHDYFLRHQKFIRRDQSVVLLMVAPHAHRSVPGASPPREQGRDPLPLRHGRRGREEGPAADLRARLEPHDAARPPRRSDDHLSADALPASPTTSKRSPDDRRSSATRCRAISNSSASTARSPASACRSCASPPRSGSTRSCRIHEDNGCPIFNPHRYTLEEGGMKQTDAVQLAFKREADPEGPPQPRQDDRLGESGLRPAAAARSISSPACRRPADAERMNARPRPLRPSGRDELRRRAARAPSVEALSASRPRGRRLRSLCRGLRSGALAPGAARLSRPRHQPDAGRRLCRAPPRAPRRWCSSHPVWNFGYPAILKGFFDRVFLPGVSFKLEGRQGLAEPPQHPQARRRRHLWRRPLARLPHGRSAAQGR